MHSELNAQLAFHLTGVRSKEARAEAACLRPALLAGYRDLPRLRYDFPLVLADYAADGQFARSLSELVDEALKDVTDERVRAQALRREREIRAQLGAAPARTLADAWTLEPPLAAKGVLADCDATLPARFVYSAWTAVQAGKRRRFNEAAERLMLELANILAADFVRSDEGRTAEQLASSLAARDESFDTGALSRLLAKALPERRLPATRRRRIRTLLATLKGQRFFAAEGSAAARGYTFVFYNCASALRAMRERQNATVELCKAFAAARLEARGEYVDAVHDPVFASLGENAIDAALVPDYLVCLNAANLASAAEGAGLAELLTSGLPVKILVQHDDILENRTRVAAQAQLVAGMALGLNDVFVLQSAASNLYALRERVLKGFEYDGAALFNVYSGASATGALPPYLAAAAAMESRAFPAFSYDPSAARPERFSLENNPQPEADWPRHTLDYEDGEHQSVREALAFTLVDFAACDRRYAGYFAATEESNAAVPTLRVVDDANKLGTVIVAEPLMREAARCLDAWHALQARATRSAPPAEEAPAAPPPAAKVESPPEAPKAPPAGDAPYIETPRCTTCEECVKINNRMFVYDANKQAYIADVKAGSYKDLVEAAESCQVSIIHPGKPLDPSEPGLAELLERAKPFL
jgi:hypothetical protein